MKRIADIAATLAGYDPDAMSVDEVRTFLDDLIGDRSVSASETLPLRDVLGRVLASDVICPVDVPPHDNAAMDGYALRGTALSVGGDLQLRVVGTALAGKTWQGTVDVAEAVRITTGAVMPNGLDTVVPREFCVIDGDEVRFPASALRCGANRRLAGEDLKAGSPALARGSLIGPAALGLVASLGLTTLPVLRRLRVAYFSTGDEIMSPGDAPREGAVYDSNRYTVFGLLTRLGCEIVDIGQVRDDPAALVAALRIAALTADAIVTSGGVSAGEADHTREAMQRVGDMAFWRVAMRPGRPMAVGLVSRPGHEDDDAGTAVLFGLPGNPVATMVTFLAFVRPALLRLMGCNADCRRPAPMLRARSVTAIGKRPGRTEYQRGFVSVSPGGSPDRLPEVRIAGNQGSGVLSSMVEANGLVVLGHSQGDVAPGETVDVLMFDGAI
ncbi:molybdopterin molybdotransferase MoeA [Variovorax sp. RHLX14]|uniref:molybdopterin molybdotransferase MoeA n=1 Tax=Variovorax sp. RHLX14 TaxID=1259731 RepID=UPI003F448A8C